MKSSTMSLKEQVKKGKLSAVDAHQRLMQAAASPEGTGVKIASESKTFRWLSRR